MFTSGQAGIESKRCENLFQELRERELSQAEEAIIAQRCALQRRMLQEYERRELRRKVAELTAICPQLDEGAARAALEACDGDEVGAMQCKWRPRMLPLALRCHRRIAPRCDAPEGQVTDTSLAWTQGKGMRFGRGQDGEAAASRLSPALCCAV